MATDSLVQPPNLNPVTRARRWTLPQVRRILGLSLLQIVVTVAVITFLIPALWMFSSALKASTEVFAHPIVWIPETPQWRNFVRVFELPGLPFARFLWNTVIVVFWAVSGTVISSVMVAYAFARLRWPGRNFFFGILIATMIIPEVITLVPRFMLYRTFGWIDTLLPLTVPYWFAGTPLYVFIIYQFFRNIPVELEEAAFIDGATRLQILIQIILPLSKPVIATVAVFALLQHYNEFINPLIFINSVSKWTLPLGIASLNANESFRATWELVFAASTVAITPVILLFIVAQRYFVQGIAMTGFGGR